ncbi:hypothetical protein LWF01_12430 [Saxibacter everestensis]|uniref:DUF4350 domain-containing protein n=1 Tax=Saxibacter everestensis TaxID=2909229 RepID=A0ABY8QR68_9MICO|nr:hypothetical protein LWF01_12430 [Brevibacteriaceae bacterium ZFBP1038]
MKGVGGKVAVVAAWTLVGLGVGTGVSGYLLTTFPDTPRKEYLEERQELLEDWPPEYDTTRIERIVDELRDDRVYVDPTQRIMLTEAGEADLSDQLLSGDAPIYVAVVPTEIYDESEGDNDLLARRIGYELGKDAVVVVHNASDTSFEASGLDVEYREGDEAKLSDTDFYSENGNRKLALTIDAIENATLSEGVPANPNPDKPTLNEEDDPGPRIFGYPIKTVVLDFVIGVLFALVPAGLVIGVVRGFRKQVKE